MKTFKFNIIDFIFAVTIFFIVGILIFTNIFNKSDSDESKITIKFYSEQIPSYIADELKENDSVYDNAKNIFLGTVKKIEINQGYIYTVDSNGAIHKSGKEGYSSVELIAEVQANMTENGVQLDGIDYQVGFESVIRVGITQYYTRISSIEVEI